MTTSPAAKAVARPAAPLSYSLSKREIAWGQRLLALFVLLVSLPYLWCAVLTPPGFTWGGLFFSADDQNVHLMWAKQAQMGSLVIRDLFTTESLDAGTHPLFFNLYTLLLGWAARLSHLDTIFWYHISRVAFAGLFIWQFHKLLVAVTGGAPEKENARLGALVLATLTTGGGVVALVAHHLHLSTGIIFVDYPTPPGFPNMPEAFALLSALIYPLNIASYALICRLLRALIENKDAGWAFVWALVLSNIHTYDALPLLVTCVVGTAASTVMTTVGILFRRGKMANREEWGWRMEDALPRKTNLQVFTAVFVGLLLPVLYQAVVFRGSEEFRVKALTPTSPPQIWHIAASFAPLILLAAWGWKAKWIQGTQKWLWIYAASILVLVYAPKSPAMLPTALFGNSVAYGNFYLFSFARKMLEGFQIPLLVFAGAGLAMLPARKFVVPFILLVLVCSPMHFWHWTLVNAEENNVSRARYFMPAYYLSDADAGALLALQQTPDKNQAVLCLPFLGSYVPRATGLTTYTGHWAETLHVNDKIGQELRFYRGQMNSSEARAFLKANHIGYIVESPYEYALAPNSSMARSLGFSPIYSAPPPQGSQPAVPTVVYKVS